MICKMCITRDLLRANRYHATILMLRAMKLAQPGKNANSVLLEAPIGVSVSTPPVMLVLNLNLARVWRDRGCI